MTSSLPTTYNNGDFSFIKDKLWRRMMDHAYKETTKLNLWDFFKQESPPDDLGYMFWDCSELDELRDTLDELDGHSGASLGYCLRSIEYIAKQGWNSYVNQILCST